MAGESIDIQLDADAGEQRCRGQYCVQVKND